ncbi:hypothetical protein Ciccas_007904 [Cichlidogyrus casuarinus]|uniref:phospholipase A2 n=1 Tax=Cichlidogyrus casuarinus TaxID=1844966 RepID=A0ABD2Q1I0_9PLAT
MRILVEILATLGVVYSHLVDLNLMLCRVSGLNSGSLLGYGYYCGSGSFGDLVPVDPTDRCCMWHDNCYGTHEDICTGRLNPKNVHYKWAVKTIGSKKKILCLDNSTSLCALYACQCDAWFSHCIYKMKGHLDPSFYKRHGYVRSFVHWVNGLYQ